MKNEPMERHFPEAEDDPQFVMLTSLECLAILALACGLAYTIGWVSCLLRVAQQ